MHQKTDFNELKKIEKEVLKGISLKDSISEVNKIAAFDIGFSGTKVICSAIIFDFETMNVIEEKTKISDELMPYSPNTIAFREGPAIIDLYRELENTPDVLIIDGQGALHPAKVGVASYVGVILNKPCIGIAKELIYGNLDEDKIIFNNEIKGYAIKAKEFANPIFITSGHGVSIEKATEIVRKTIVPDFKLPLPMHLAHKLTNKIKKAMIGINDGM